MLTDVAVKNAKPGRHSDAKGSGLMLEVRPSGGRFWLQRIMVGGKRRDLGLGSYPDVSLSEARARAQANREAVAAGRDILAERAAAKAAAAAPAEPAPDRTFAAALDAYLAAHGAGWRNPKTARQAKEAMQKHAAALLPRHVAEVDVAAVHAVLAPIWATKAALATKLRGRLEGVCEWAIAAGWRSGPNPAAWKGALRPLLARPESVLRNKHHAALPWQRVPAFMAALNAEAGNAARCLAFTILTACRSGEARAAVWGEVDLAAAVWAVPAGKMKSGRAHRVPVAPAAVALLRGMLPADGSMPAADALIFPNPEGAAYSDMGLLAVLKRLDAASLDADEGGWRDEVGARITAHGFRSSFRDWAGDNGHPRELAEAALAHAFGDATERAYARSDLFARRRALMDAWAEHAAGAPQPGNVIPLRRAAG